MRIKEHYRRGAAGGGREGEREGGVDAAPRVLDRITRDFDNFLEPSCVWVISLDTITINHLNFKRRGDNLMDVMLLKFVSNLKLQE